MNDQNTSSKHSSDKASGDADLSNRIKAAQQKARGPEIAERPPVQKQAMKMGLDLVAGTLVGFVLGMALDDWLGTRPLFLIVLLLLGVAAGLRNSFRELQRFQAAGEQSGQEETSARDGKRPD